MVGTRECEWDVVSGDVDHHHHQQHGIEIVFCAENEWLAGCG